MYICLQVYMHIQKHTHFTHTHTHILHTPPTHTFTHHTHTTHTHIHTTHTLHTHTYTNVYGQITHAPARPFSRPRARKWRLAARLRAFFCVTHFFCATQHSFLVTFPSKYMSESVAHLPSHECGPERGPPARLTPRRAPPPVAGRVPARPSRAPAWT